MSVEKSAAWHCIDCNPIGMVPVVADYESLKSALQEFGAEPPEAIQKPQQYKFPTKVPNPGRSWICGCQLVFARGLAEEVSVLVYLDQRKYLMETGYVKDLDEFEPERNEESEKEWEGSEELSSVDSILRLHADELDSSYTEQSNQSYNDFYAENRTLENELGESRDYGDTPMLAKNDHVRDDVSVNSNFTSVSQLADLHGFMSDQDGELIIVENDHDSFTDDGSMTAWDRELARLAKHHGVDLSKDLNTVTEIQSEIESHLTNVLVNLEGSVSRPARKKQSAQDAEDKDLHRLLANIMQYVEMVQEPSPAPIVPDQPVEIVEVSDEEEDLAAASVTKKKKRVMRHKTAGLISLEEIGLSEEKDNFIRAGDVEKTGSWISPIDFNDEELMNCIDLRAFRTYFRENIKRRVEEDSYIPSVTIEQLHEEIRDVENELDGLKLQQDMLKTIIDSYSLPTNPVERVLLSFRHPQKLHGQPINMDESIISNYKLALQQDEIQMPNEFTDNLPLEQFYLIQRFCKDEPILQLLKKITPQPPLPINIDTSQSAYFVKRPVLDLHYNLEAGAFEEPTGPMGGHLTEAYSPVEEIAKTTELFDL